MTMHDAAPTNLNSTQPQMAQPCPSCGHCPTCGRSPATVYPNWYYPPTYPYPWTQIWCGTTTNTTAAPISFTAGG